MTTDLTAAQAELADAQRERKELDDLIAGLENRVRAGEAAEAERELGEQYSLQRLAQVRQEAAEQRMRDAEVAELRERRQRALTAAEAELAAVSATEVARKYAAAVAALDDLATTCGARDEVTRQHLAAFRELGMSDQIIADQPHQRVIEVGGERFEVGTWTPDRVVPRAVGRVGRIRRLNTLVAAAQGFAGVHEVERIAAGMSRQEAAEAEAVGSFATQLIQSARWGGRDA